MQKIKYYILLFFVFSTYISAQAQDNIKFNDGVFISFDDFKHNKSIAFSQLITNNDLYNENSVKEFLNKKKIYFFDNNGIKQELKTKIIWGYCINNKIYIHYNNEYNIIPFVGSISHFIANKQVYHNTYTDPFADPYSAGYNNYSTSESREYILDFDTGVVYEFNTKNFLLLLSKDNELYTEFVNLKKRKQRQMMYIYLRRFNEKHQISLLSN